MSCCSASTCTSSPRARAVSLVTGPIETTRAPARKRSRPTAAMKKRTVELDVNVT